MLKKYDKFYSKVWKTGSSNVITIPSNIVKGVGLNDGDELEIYIRKERE